MKRRKAFTKEEREIQIINHAIEVYGLSCGASITASQVANWIGVGGTQARTLLIGLKKQGVLIDRAEPYPGVCGKVVLYAFTDEYIVGVEEKKYSIGSRSSNRRIKINSAQSSFEVAI